MEIYQATIDDLEGVSQLVNGYRMFYEQTSDVDGASDFIKERLENEDSVIFVVKSNQSYLGFTQLYPIFSSVSMKKAWLLNDLFITEDARKQGIGEMLLQTAKDFAIKTNAKSIMLSTAVENCSAQRLYEKNGYERDSQFYQYELSLQY